MTQPVFETHWTINGEQYFNIDDVAALVEAGRVAVEIPAEKQARDYEMRLLQERWHRRALDRYEKHVTEAAHRDSPEGRAETARREAAQHGGSRVTLAGSNPPAFDELDRYSPPQTNKLR